MDEMNEDPSEVSSFRVNKMRCPNIVDLNKKRKLIDELLGLPPSKHKFRERSTGSEQQLLPYVEVLAAEEVKEMIIKQCPKENSEMDSNSFIGESYSSTSQSTEATSQTFEPGFVKAYGGGRLSSSTSQSPTLPWSCSNSNFENIAYSSESRSIEESDKEEEDSSFLKNQKLIGNYANHIYSDHGSGEIEEFLDIESEEEMLYSNAALTSDLFVLSSGRWNINKDSDAGLGAKKPTIDQEFEQYFSMLML